MPFEMSRLFTRMTKPHPWRRADLARPERPKGQSLVEGVLEVVDRLKPLHLSIVGGGPAWCDIANWNCSFPLLFWRAESTCRLLPAPSEPWSDLGEPARLHVVVSIDGLQPEHDVRSSAGNLRSHSQKHRGQGSRSIAQSQVK